MCAVPSAKRVIGYAARGRWAALDHIEPIAGFRAVAAAAASRKVPSVADIAGTTVSKVRVQRQDDFGFGQVVKRMNRLAKRHLGPGAGVVAIDRFVLVPLGLGKFGPQGLQPGARGSEKSPFGSGYAGQHRRWPRASSAAASDPLGRCSKH